ncbi:MAG: glycerate kinase, partial [Dehalococcoidia bacterium]|nr:glycerate kinase [Dehalococcoidia bacterium]
GTARVVAAAAGGQMLHARVRGALGDPVEAAYAWLERPGEPPTALVESATVVGLLLTPPEARDPALASTEGVGELVLDAVRRGARRVILGCGGTGTSDGGSGLARALGLRLLDAAGLPLPPGPAHLVRLARVEAPDEPVLPGVEVRVAVDVQNVLTGPAGAVAVYGRQKGIPDWQAPALDAALTRWAERVRVDLGREIEAVPGAGAGGGLPAGVLAAVPHAYVESGAALVARAVGLAETMRGVDLVVTGEGSLDAQTAHGKAVAQVVVLATAAGVPCLAVAGSVAARPSGIADAEPVSATDGDPMRDAARLAADAAERLARRYATA